MIWGVKGEIYTPEEKEKLQVKKKEKKDPNLRLPKDFGEDEKMVVIQELLVNPIISETLLEKYKTSTQTIRKILREKGLNQAPSDPSQMRDYPQYAERKLLKNFLIHDFHFVKVSWFEFKNQQRPIYVVNWHFSRCPESY